MADLLPNLVESAFRKIDLAAAERHVFLCVGPDCCAPEAGLASWETLKLLLKQNQLSMLRTKAACFRICSGGPWMLVYPEGVWYGAVTPERCERIVREHFVGGNPVHEWVVKEHKLSR